MHELESRPAEAPVRELRRRLAADLHDGVGARLNMLLASLDPDDPVQGPLCQGLHDCLLDLQMTLEGLDGAEDLTVAEALGRLRHRVQPALDRQRIRLVWRVEVDAGQGIDADGRQAICKVAQEALANVLRHSQAREVTLSWRTQAPDGWVLEVADDGIGLSQVAAVATAGRGLRSMRERARRLGGVLRTDPCSPRGTWLRLLVPAPGG